MCNLGVYICYTAIPISTGGNGRDVEFQMEDLTDKDALNVSRESVKAAVMDGSLTKGRGPREAYITVTQEYTEEEWLITSQTLIVEVSTTHIRHLATPPVSQPPTHTHTYSICSVFNFTLCSLIQ